jgi:Uncharacterized protein related to plant photosystem II stability/assembly factor
VLDAQAFAGGRGYVRTDDALLWTDNGGKTWRSITPPGVRAAQLERASVVVHADGSAWIALAPRAGGTTVTVLRLHLTGAWRSIDLPLGRLSVPRGGEGLVWLSWPDARDGWLIVAEMATANSITGEMFRTTDGGGTWTLQLGPQWRRGAGDIHFVTSAVGFLDTLPGQQWWITRDAGRSWAPLRLPTPSAKRHDTVTLDTPTQAGNAIVIAATYATPVQGNPAGLVLFRSTDLGRTWTAEKPSDVPPSEQYDFAITPDGRRTVLLGAQHSGDFASYTWATSLSSDGGAQFSSTTSRNGFYPDSVLDRRRRHRLGDCRRRRLHRVQDRLLAAERAGRLHRRR